MQMHKQLYFFIFKQTEVYHRAILNVITLKDNLNYHKTNNKED